jgi:hypothetical protein
LGFDPLCDQSLFQARRKGSALQRHCRRKRGAPLIDKVALSPQLSLEILAA